MTYLILEPEKLAAGDTEGAEILERIRKSANAADIGVALRRGLYCVLPVSSDDSAKQAAAKMDLGHLAIEIGGCTWVRQTSGAVAIAVDVPCIRDLPLAGGGRYGDLETRTGDTPRGNDVDPGAIMELFQRIRVDARLTPLSHPEDTLARRAIVSAITKEVAADWKEDHRALANALATRISRYDREETVSPAP